MRTLILAAMIGIGLASNLATSLVDEGKRARITDVLLGLATGNPTVLGLAQVQLLALAGFVIFVVPLLVIGALWMIELRIGRSGPRPRKNYVLVWSARVIFVTSGSLIAFAGLKLGLRSDTPLLRAPIASGPGGAPLQAFTMYMLAFFISDLFRYWFHRAQHRFEFLWRFHAVHHAPRDLDVLHNLAHPVEKLGDYLLVLVPTAFLIGGDVEGLYLVAAFTAIHTHLVHMNAPVNLGVLGYVISDNRYHFVHHSRDPCDHGKNFAGLFPIIDMMFGTYRKPVRGELSRTGLDRIPEPETLGQYLLPGSTRSVLDGGSLSLSGRGR